MKVLYDLTATQSRGKTKFHGGGEYAKTVFKALCNSNLCVEILCIYFENMEMEDWLLEFIVQEKIKAFPIKNFREIDEICKREQIDVFYSALPVAFKKRPVNSTVLMKGTIHGLRGIECPSDKYAVKYYKAWRKCIRYIKNIFSYIVKIYHKEKMKKTLEMLDACICVSEHTKYAIKVNFPQYTKKIEVYYTPQKKIDNKKNVRLDERYLLLVSANRWLKNSYRAILAIDKLFGLGFLDQCNVKIVGKMPEHTTKSIQNRERFEFLDYIPTNELEVLYQNCELFIYPSLNEGFGMPPIEAMKYGITCVISAISSLTEIYGDAVYYFNPADIDEMETRILYAYENKLKEEKIKAKELEVRQRQEKDLKKICEFILN